MTKIDRTVAGSQRVYRAQALSMLAAACALACAGHASAQNQTLQSLLVPEGAEVAANSEPSGDIQVRVIVQFNESPVSRMRKNLDVTQANRAEMASYSLSLKQLKAPRLAAIAQLGGRVQNTLEFVLNGAVVDIPASRIAILKRLPGVKSVRRAGEYRLSQSAPPTVGELIGTLPVNTSGNTGVGVVIAYLDSGVDYTHASFSGPGTAAYFNNAVAGNNGGIIGDTPGVFPNGPTVKGGYDWVGETWCGSSQAACFVSGVLNSGPLKPGALVVTPDPDPIDRSGHGTQGASAAAGVAVAASNLRAGSAPGAVVLAYKVCSSISSSCEGSSLLNSMDSAMQYAAGIPNPASQNGSNNPPLPVGTRFVINMSLGSGYGNELVDDLSEASRNAVRAGITVVASAGNANDIPFIVGTPSATETVISVASSQPELLTGPTLSVGAPLNQTYPITPAAFGGTLAASTTLALALAGPNAVDGSSTNLACSTTGSGTTNPLQPATLVAGTRTNTITIGDRGTCSFNEKGLNIQRAGASVVLIANNQPGSITMGAAPLLTAVTVPSFSMLQVDGTALKGALISNPGLQGTVSLSGDLPNVSGGVNLVDLISDFSSRGPSQNGFAAKPDITAPGSSIYMAAFGTGNRGTVASGTSFSGPLTSGIAALVLAARPTFTPWQVKAAIMNTANTNVFATKTVGGNTLAGITRMGAGRVQADRAVATQTLAYDSVDIDPTATVYYNTALSFGPQAFTAAGATTVKRTVVVQNLGGSSKTYAISVANRFANDLGKGVVFAPSTTSLTVPGNSTATFDLNATATGAALPTSGGFPVKLQQTDTCTTTANPPARDATCTGKFDNVELDGLVTIDGGNPNDRITVPYLMYPRAASRVAASRIGAAVVATNTGVANTIVDVFNLIGAQDPQDQGAPDAINENLPIDIRAVGVRYSVNAIPPPLPTGVTSGDVMEFAISLWKPMDTWRIATFNIEVDINNDGVADFMVRNLNTTANRQSVFIAPVTPSLPNGGTNGGGFFSAAATLSSTKMVLPVFASLLGVNQNTRIGVRVKSSNGSTASGSPVFDTVPDSNTFQYFRPSALVNVPTVRSFQLNANASGRFNFNSNSANLATSPGDKGLLLFYGDNVVTAESTVLQLVP